MGVRRAGVPVATRRKLIGRHGGKCAKCVTGKSPQVHHIVRVADGGGNEIQNLCLLCKRCHKEWHKRRGEIDFWTWASIPPADILAKIWLTHAPKEMVSAWKMVKNAYAENEGWGE